ncbi:MAG: tRNA (adenosine(37)-N6)-dimethylallyltransferase MiaA [Bdellovibrionota bacterium]
MAELSKGTLTFIVGPTASGKTQLALDLARAENGIIVNGDSLQVFRQLDIGTAKPSLQERQLCPHFLFDIVDVGQEFTAGEYRRAALKVIEDNIEKHNIFIVGGSGFYLRALDKGMFNVEAVPAETVAQVESWQIEKGNQFLWDELKARDADSAKAIHVNDSYRLVRALSVVLHTGKAWSQMKQDFKDNEQTLSDRFTVKKIGLQVDREKLRSRVEQRTQNMLADGLVAEVQGLLKIVRPDWAPLQSVGYKEVLQFLQGELAEADLAATITQSTMRLAKKQMTWFKKDLDVEWRPA